MKKYRLLIALFIILAIATGWYLLSERNAPASNLGWDRQFAVEDEDEIYKIFIARRDSITTVLERKGDHWIVNGRYKARPNAMHNILEAITQVELKYVPPRAALDNIVREMAARGIKVEIYNKAGKKIKSYYVGGVTADARGTYMLMEGSEQPMVVGLPNLDGQIRTRYDMVGDDWRDRTVFDYDPDDIQAVSIEYPLHRKHSFRLQRKGSSFEVKPFYPDQIPVDQPVDKASCEAFLYNFQDLIAENFDNKNPRRDSIVQNRIPFAIVSVTDREGETFSASFIPFWRANAASGGRTADEVERYFLDTSTGDFMVVQHGVFKKIFWSYEAFFEKPPSQVKG
ncbi:MAG: hypothetical protein KatS3mg029_0110 [Saprospiraceae bacterium]|nr:MAG: hypothetical protein KatS3mg029_0110 [Saprospiraceae bacterium]